MKLEVGMYCYNKCNRELGIGKILTEPSKNNNVGIIYKHGHAPVVSVGNVIASHNIIDLIEVGDYVNGHKVFLVKENSIRIEEREQTWGVMEIETIDIKTIVTKQQFESMQYEV